MRSIRFFPFLAPATIVVFAGGLAACTGDDNAVSTNDAGAQDSAASGQDTSTSDTGVRVDATDGGTPADSTTPTTDGSSTDGAQSDAPSTDGAQSDSSPLDGSPLDGPLVDTGPTATVYVANLDGKQETPAVTTTATGSATITVSADQSTLTYHVTHTVVGATAAHIHLGAGGEAGPVAFPLSGAGATIDGTIALTNGLGDGGGLTLTQAQILDDLKNGLFYVNVHSGGDGGHPAGEIRGQILHPNDTLYVATLTGAQETPPVTSTGTGTSAVILNTVSNLITYHVSTSLVPTAAHIHSAIGSISGPVVFPLGAQPPTGMKIDGSLSLATGDAGIVDPAEIAAGHWYVNVHTAAHNPGGEIRGQLLLPGQVLYTANMSPANEVPPVTSTATGGAQFILTGTSLAYEVLVSGFTPVSADINPGAVADGGTPLYTLIVAPPGAKGTLPGLTAGDIVNLNSSLFYVNAHSTAFPGGELRGQIVRQ